MKLYIYDNRHIKKQVFNIEKNSYIVLENELSIFLWRQYFKYNNLNEIESTINYVKLEKFLSEEFKMKFDAIVGNPPYEGDNNKGNKKWIVLLNKVLDLSDNISFVVPLSLLTSKSEVIVNTRKRLNDRDNIFDLSKKDAFNVGEKVVFFTTKVSDKKGSTLKFSDGSVKKINNIIERLPVNPNDELKLSIFKKIEQYPNKILESNDYVYDFSRDSNQTTPNRLIKQGLVSETQSEIFKYEVHHSASKTLYSKVLVSKYSKNNESTYGKLKVILNYSGGFVGDKYMFLSKGMVGKQMFGILVENETIGKNMINVYSSKLFRWYIALEKNSGFNSGIYYLPKLDFTLSWKDEDLYKFFNLTQEEIGCIENYVG